MEEEPPDIVDTSPRLETGKTENETKAILIKQVLDLQNTLDALSRRVDSVKHDNTKLHSDNQLLTQYIESLQSASAHGGATKSRK